MFLFSYQSEAVCEDCRDDNMEIKNAELSLWFLCLRVVEARTFVDGGFTPVLGRS